jgi:hypothetical protein
MCAGSVLYPLPAMFAWWACYREAVILFFLSLAAYARCTDIWKDRDHRALPTWREFMFCCLICHVSL